MKVGDLVRFSAYGKRLQCNRNVSSHDPIGVVIRLSLTAPWFYVSWCGLGEILVHGNRRRYLRKDLKYASR